MFTCPRKNPRDFNTLATNNFFPIFGCFNSPTEHLCSWTSEWVFRKFLKVRHKMIILVIHRGNRADLEIKPKF